MTHPRTIVGRKLGAVKNMAGLGFRVAGVSPNKRSMVMRLL